MKIVTEQEWNESPYIIRGKDKGFAAWHYILVPINKVAELKNHGSDETIDITLYGRVIYYITKQGEEKLLCGWGEDPPEILRKWIDDHYS